MLRYFYLLCAGIFIAIYGVILTSCNAPRENPLDPNSSNYIAPQMPEAVSDLSLGEQNGSACKLVWTAPEGAAAYHLYYGGDQWNGINLSQATEYPGEMTGVKPAETMQYQWVDVAPNDTTRWVLFSISEEGLESEPSNMVEIITPKRNRQAVTSIIARTRRLELWSALDWISFEVDAIVADTDGVDSVWIEWDDVSIGKLTNMGDGRSWAGEFPDFDLPTESVDALIGHSLFLHHLDREGFSTSDEEFTLVRVIRTVPTIYAPAANDTVGPLPELRWRGYGEAFEFAYIITITHINQAYVPTVVLVDTITDPYQTTYQVQDSLTLNPQYFLWTVSILDEFENEARSSEAIFRVMPNE